MTRLHFLRHAPTHSPNMIGWTDLPADLSDTDQQARIHALIPGDALCISSDLQRCVDTLASIAGHRKILPPDPNLREIHFGDWENKHHSEVSASHPELTKEFWTNPGSVAAPNGESWNDASTRITSAVAKLVAETDAKDILICCHFGAILTQLAHHTRISAQSAFGFKIDNYALTSIEILGKDASRVLRVNHLA